MTERELVEEALRQAERGRPVTDEWMDEARRVLRPELYPGDPRPLIEVLADWKVPDD